MQVHMDEGADRKMRRFPRYEVKVLVDLTGSDVLLYHKVQNISLGGLSLQTPSLEEVGTIVDLVVSFPDLGEPPLNVKGEVVWANREPPEDMGIRWLDLDEEKREILRRYLALVTGSRFG